MNALFAWVESTALSVWVRESTSVFAFPSILAAHAIGMGLAAGINSVFAFHLLGVARGVPTRELARFIPVMWFGFWLNAASGVLLLLAYPTKALTNPIFYVKLALIALAMTIFMRLRHLVLRGRGGDADGGRDADGVRDADRGRGLRLQPEPSAAMPVGPRVRVLAAVAVLAWAGAITSGRFLAYTYTRLMADW